MAGTVSLTKASDVIRSEDLAEATDLTKEQQQAIKDKYDSINKHMQFGREDKGKYKIELFFHHRRTRNGLNAVLMNFWESAAAMHGGGDSRIYLCPGSRLRNNGCAAPIPSDANVNGKMMCSKCGVMWDAEETIGEIFFNLPLQRLAESITKYYHVLGGHADICIKYSQDDLRSVLLSEQERDRGGELFDKLYAARSVSVYPLANIIKDVSAGADLTKRFYAFLVA